MVAVDLRLLANGSILAGLQDEAGHPEIAAF
jgi:hypothetical protein